MTEHLYAVAGIMRYVRNGNSYCEECNKGAYDCICRLYWRVIQDEDGDMSLEEATKKCKEMNDARNTVSQSGGKTG